MSFGYDSTIKIDLLGAHYKFRVFCSLEYNNQFKAHKKYF